MCIEKGDVTNIKVWELPNKTNCFETLIFCRVIQLENEILITKNTRQLLCLKTSLRGNKRKIIVIIKL